MKSGTRLLVVTDSSRGQPSMGHKEKKSPRGVIVLIPTPLHQGPRGSQEHSCTSAGRRSLAQGVFFKSSVVAAFCKSELRVGALTPELWSLDSVGLRRFWRRRAQVMSG